jgi:hypothetical protein
LMAFFLLTPDLRRLIDFFFLNRTAEPSTQIPIFAAPRANRMAFAAQLVFGLWLIGMNAYGSYRGWQEYGGARPKSPLYGIWKVEEQTLDGQANSPLLTDSGRWRRMVFDSPARATIQRADDSLARYGAVIDVKANSLQFSSDADKNWKAAYTFQRPSPDQLSLEGDIVGHKSHVQLKLVDLRSFELVSRGFHWIQEYPYNR